MIDPQSTAGVLLREHDNPLQAFDYATRMAKRLLAMNNSMGLDYARAADQLGYFISEQSSTHPA